MKIGEMSPLAIPNPWGGRCWFRARTPSTMEDARLLETAGEPSGSLVRTDEQWAGRGRHRDRKWESTPGDSLLFTGYWDFSTFRQSEFAVSLVFGLGLCYWLESLGLESSGSAVRLKWPNDLYVNDHKIAGILVQTKIRNGSPLSVHAGLGINLRQTSFPGDYRRPPSSLRMAGIERSPDEALEELLPHLYQAMMLSDPRKEAERRLWRRGESYEVDLPGLEGNEKIHGVLHGLGSRGELQLETKEGIREIHTGE